MYWLNTFEIPCNDGGREQLHVCHVKVSGKQERTCREPLACATKVSPGCGLVALPQFILIFYSVLKSLAFVSTEFTTAKQDVDEMYREAPIKGGLFDYVEFTRILKHGAKEKDEQ